jgi:hypothetical protein
MSGPRSPASGRAARAPGQRRQQLLRHALMKGCWLMMMMTTTTTSLGSFSTWGCPDRRLIKQLATSMVSASLCAIDWENVGVQSHQ